MARHFLRIMDLGRDEAHAMVERALAIKKADLRSDAFAGKTFILLFEKASTRTRVSFEVAVSHFGGKTIFMTGQDSQLGRSEPLKDTARVLSRYADCLIVRTFGQSKLEELAHFGSIPVVNALSDLLHPCQVMSDLLTMYERTPNFQDLKVAWVGDGNNMAHSWINAAIYFPFQLSMAFPEGYEPDSTIMERALKMGARIFFTHDAKSAVDGAHYVNTDVWASMGQEDQALERAGRFGPYQVNAKLLEHADPSVKVLHCLPAHRGEEISEEVMEGPASLVWDQAENRLHMQKALLEWVMKG